MSMYFQIFTLVFGIGCGVQETPLPTEELVTQADTTDLPAKYQILYNSPLIKADGNQQRVRILLWLQRMNCNVSQLQKLDELRKIALEKQESLVILEQQRQQLLLEAQTPLYNQIWDGFRQGMSIDAPELEIAFTELANTQIQHQQDNMLDIRLETIKSIIEAEDTFLRSLSPEQESSIVDALYFLRHKLDPVGNPKDFSALIGNTFEPGQYAILLKGTSQLARQSGNIGGLWSDEPELTGRVLHEAQREVVLYLLLLEPALEEAIRVATELQQTQSNTP